MARTARKLAPLVLSHEAYSAGVRTPEVLAPLPIGKLPTFGYLRAMIERGAKEAGREFYDPIVELVKLGTTTQDERIAFACHAHLSDKLYPKARDWADADNPDDADRIAKRNAMLDQLVTAFGRRVLSK